MFTPTELERWIALVRFDDEIRDIAEQLHPYGTHWVDEFGRAFFALKEDRKYLPSILVRLLAEAQLEQLILRERAVEEENARWGAAFAKTAEGEDTTSQSIAVLRRAEAKGYSIEVEVNRTIVMVKGTSKSYLRSNYDIKRFGEYL